MTDPEKLKLDDSIKLAIREEVEKAFLNPPANLTQRIETEVRQRVADKEKFYGVIGAIALTAITIVFYSWFHATINNVGEKVGQALGEKNVTEARDRVAKIDAEVQARGANISIMTDTIESEYLSFTNRLAQIKQQDNVLLSEDLPKLFVRQSITNFADGNRIIFDYVPVPQTVKMIIRGSSYNIIALSNDCRCLLEGSSIVFTSNEFAKAFLDMGKSGQLGVEYVRASRSP